MKALEGMSELVGGQRDVEHFVIGEGALCCIVEWRRTDDAPYGLLVGFPGMLTRRESTLLWHPEHALRRTMLTAVVDGVRHTPRPGTTSVRWDRGDVLVEWRAGQALVAERFAFSRATLLRSVRVTVDDGLTARVQVEAALYANPTIFASFGSDELLSASGLLHLWLRHDGGELFERFVRTPERVVDGVATFGALAYGCLESEWPAPESRVGSRYGDIEDALETMAGADDRPPRTRQLIRSRRGLRAAIGFDGRFNASLLQYEFEWGLDAAMAAAAASVAGDHPLAAEILENILTRLSNDAGMITEAGRFRGGELSELNGNGAVLDAVWKYWLYTRDTALVQLHWDRIVAIAEYPLHDEFAHESGLLRTRRDFWERFPWQGVGDGFELGHQVLCCVGLASAAKLARVVRELDRARRWQEAADRIHTAMLEHPRLSLVDGGRFVRRRLVDGSVERDLVPDPSWRREEYAPYLPGVYDTDARSCEPDVTELLPVVYGLVDPHSGLARATLDAIETLWSPNGIGGYARYDVASEPDSPGPWPFASAFVAAAQLAAGECDRAERTIDWLLAAAGAGGSWLEYYGERESPPHPPIGIIVWGWAQYILLAVEAMAGVEVDRHHVRIRPRAVGIEHTLRLGPHAIHLDIRGLTSATLDGEPSSLDIALPLPLRRDHHVVYS